MRMLKRRCSICGRSGRVLNPPVSAPQCSNRPNCRQSLMAQLHQAERSIASPTAGTYPRRKCWAAACKHGYNEHYFGQLCDHSDQCGCFKYVSADDAIHTIRWKLKMLESSFGGK